MFPRAHPQPHLANGYPDQTFTRRHSEPSSVSCSSPECNRHIHPGWPTISSIPAIGSTGSSYSTRWVPCPLRPTVYVLFPALTAQAPDHSALHVFQRVKNNTSCNSFLSVDRKHTHVAYLQHSSTRPAYLIPAPLEPPFLTQFSSSSSAYTSSRTSFGAAVPPPFILRPLPTGLKRPLAHRLARIHERTVLGAAKWSKVLPGKHGLQRTGWAEASARGRAVKRDAQHPSCVLLSPTFPAAERATHKTEMPEVAAHPTWAPPFFAFADAAIATEERSRPKVRRGARDDPPHLAYGLSLRTRGRRSRVWVMRGVHTSPIPSYELLVPASNADRVIENGEMHTENAFHGRTQRIPACIFDHTLPRIPFGLTDIVSHGRTIIRATAEPSYAERSGGVLLPRPVPARNSPVQSVRGTRRAHPACIRTRGAPPLRSPLGLHTVRGALPQATTYAFTDIPHSETHAYALHLRRGLGEARAKRRLRLRGCVRGTGKRRYHGYGPGLGLAVDAGVQTCKCCGRRRYGVYKYCVTRYGVTVNGQKGGLIV
ncbi:hypothetical protein C8R43DRAFT_947482 [Mycena crocata]|nr:hypothetical protein C8R43DRAFT_947482 [Mycena crocata]